MSLKKGATTAIKDCMRVKKGETVLILTDTEKEEIGRALFEAAQDSKAEIIYLKMLPRTRHGEEPPKAIADLMKSVDVVIAPTKFSLSHTQARKRANRAGTRIATMPGITVDMMSEGGMTADFNKIAKNIEKLNKRLKGKKHVKLTTELGTDLEMSLEGRTWVTDDTGICQRKGGFTNLPAGEMFIPPKEGTANGTLFIDGAFHEKLTEPVKVIISDGHATRFHGAKKIAQQLSSRGKGGRNVAELGIGMNPKARITGNVLEDEKVLGTVHIAFGDNSTFGGKVKCGIHMDGIITKPTLTVDDDVILDKGKLKL